MSSDSVEYTIHFTAEIADYIGSGKVKIVDTLPYKIDTNESELNEGIYDEETATITWEEELEHINTYRSNESYKIDITKNISLKYQDIDLTKDKMTNNVLGKVELYDSEEKDEATANFDTEINVEGKVKVRYVNKETGKDFTYIERNDDGEEIEKTYDYEIIGKIGTDYTTEAKEIDGCELVEIPKNAKGKITEETIIVKYSYKIKSTQEIPTQPTPSSAPDTPSIPTQPTPQSLPDTPSTPTQPTPQSLPDTPSTPTQPTPQSLPDTPNTPPQQTTDIPTTQSTTNTPIQQTIVVPNTPTSTPTIIPSTSNISSVYTGDNEHIEIYIVIVGMAAVYLIGLIVIVIIKNIRNK